MDQQGEITVNEETYGTVRGFFVTSASWFVGATVAGIIMAIALVAPDFIRNIPWLVFGRIRPIHTNVMIFGFVGSALLGATHYLVPTLVRAPLYSEKIGRITLWIWNLALAAGTITLALGYTQSREYAEWIWPVDIMVLLSFSLMFYNLLKTVILRQEKLLYVSIWYSFAALVFTFFIYFFGNAVWNPATGAIIGMPDAILAWFYGHGVVGLFLTPLAVGVAYYVIPIVSRAPLFSHALSLLGFWSILMFYPHIGTHHLLQTPAPTWLKVVAITGSIGMLIPVQTVLLNLWLTVRGRLGNIHADIGGKFVFAGLVWYMLVCLQGSLQSLPYVQRLTHLNNWVIAHAHIAVLGFSGFIGLGGVYFTIPRITGRPLYSNKLADIQYWLILIGLTGFFLVLTTAGLIQGNGWLNGEVVYRILPQIYVYFFLRASLGILIVGGAVIGLYNILRSLYGSHPSEDRSI
jgi:cytochrome c oxidase cbb3-type subunit 1